MPKARWPVRLIVAAAMIGAGVRAVSGDEMIEKSMPTGALRVAVAIGNAGGAFWTHRDDAGRPAGVAVDLGRALAAKLGRPLALVTFDNSGQITDAAAEDRWDVTFIPMDEERRKKLDFGPVYDVSSATYLVPAGSPAQRAEDVDKKGARVGAVANTTTMRAAAASLKEATITGYQTIAEIQRLMQAGQIDAIALPAASMVPLAAALPGSRILPGHYFMRQAAVAVPPHHDDLLAAASAFVEDAKSHGLLRQVFDANGLKDTPIPDAR